MESFTNFLNQQNRHNQKNHCLEQSFKRVKRDMGCIGSQPARSIELENLQRWMPFFPFTCSLQCPFLRIYLNNPLAKGSAMAVWNLWEIPRFPGVNARMPQKGTVLYSVSHHGAQLAEPPTGPVSSLATFSLGNPLVHCLKRAGNPLCWGTM